MGALARGLGVLTGLLIIANIVSMVTACSKPVAVPEFQPAAIERVEAPAGMVRVDLDATDPELVDRLVSLGYRGIGNDGCECVYVAPFTVVDVPGGTWTMTPDTGPRKCEDGTTRECTGREFLPNGSGR